MAEHKLKKTYKKKGGSFRKLTLGGKRRRSPRRKSPRRKTKGSRRSRRTRRRRRRGGAWAMNKINLEEFDTIQKGGWGFRTKLLNNN